MMVSMAYFPTYNYFVSCAPGLEKLLAGELRTLRCRSVRPQRLGVQFKGTVKDGYRVCLWSRIGSRVLMEIAEVSARSSDEFYEEVKEIAWEKHLRPEGTLYIGSVGGNLVFKNTQFINVRTKDAIVDRFREMTKKRPSVKAKFPDVRLHVVVRKDRATIAIDLAGIPLHLRMYRTDKVQVVAPMKETLADALLMFAGWPRIAHEGGPFVDFMCGSGTLPIEAAMIAGDIAPGLQRKWWGFTNWLGHDQEAWDKLIDEAKNRREVGIKSVPPIIASDWDGDSTLIAFHCIRRAGVEGLIDLRTEDFTEVERPDSDVPGLIALNPPYGLRLGEPDELPALYRELKETLEENWSGYRLAIITPDRTISEQLGLRPQHTYSVKNGSIETEILTYNL